MKRVVALLVALTAFSSLAFAQDTPPPNPVPPNIMAWLYNPLILLGLGMLLARAPKIREAIANRAIPYLQVAVAWLGTVIGGGVTSSIAGPFGLDVTAHSQSVLAWLGSLTPAAHAGGDIAVIGLFGIAVKGMFAGLAGACWQTVQSHLLYRVFLHKQIGPDPSGSRQ